MAHNEEASSDDPDELDDLAREAAEHLIGMTGVNVSDDPVFDVHLAGLLDEESETGRAPLDRLTDGVVGALTDEHAIESLGRDRGIQISDRYAFFQTRNGRLAVRYSEEQVPGTEGVLARPGRGRTLNLFLFDPEATTGNNFIAVSIGDDPRMGGLVTVSVEDTDSSGGMHNDTYDVAGQAFGITEVPHTRPVRDEDQARALIGRVIGALENRQHDGAATNRASDFLSHSPHAVVGETSPVDPALFMHDISTRYAG